MLLVPPTFLLLIGSVIGTVLLGKELRRDQIMRALEGALIPMSFTVAILMCGALFTHTGGYGVRAPEWPNVLVWALLLGHLVAATVLATSRSYREERPFLIATYVGELAYSFGAAVASSMSVTGQWL